MDGYPELYEMASEEGVDDQDVIGKYQYDMAI